MTKAQSLFEQYRKECGMDDDDVKAARWYKDGLIDFADWLLQQKCEQCNVSGALPVVILEAEMKEIPKLKDFASGHGDAQGYARLCGQEILLTRLIKKARRQ